MTWTVVVPVKVLAQAKTRLAGDLGAADRVSLVRAMVADTVTAARATPAVGRVLVVTDDEGVGTDLRGSGRLAGAASWAALEIVPEPAPARGLNAAIEEGARHARATGAGPVAVLLGDLPALRPADLDAALAVASAHPLAVVLDADGTGTTLLTASAGVVLRPAFGAGSAAEHRRRGHVELEVPARSGLRQDVDLVPDLATVAELGAGALTARVLGRLAASVVVA